jgi:hypothetical protein
MEVFANDFREEATPKICALREGSDFDRFLTQHSPYMPQHSPQNSSRYIQKGLGVAPIKLP